MRVYAPRFSNTIAMPSSVVGAASRDAAAEAVAAFASAERELSLPAQGRRTAREIHASVLAAHRLAIALARKVTR